MPFVGETLPVSLQLWDFNTAKFTRVILRDNDGVDLVGSPFDMTHIGNGKYTLDTVVMPSGVEYIEATYEVYSSAADRTAGTPLDPGYTSATDVFRFEVPDQVLQDLLEQILAKVNALLNMTSGELLVGIVEDDIMGVFEEEQIVGVFEAPAELVGKLTQDELIGLLKAADLVGKLDC